MKKSKNLFVVFLISVFMLTAVVPSYTYAEGITDLSGGNSPFTSVQGQNPVQQAGTQIGGAIQQAGNALNQSLSPGGGLNNLFGELGGFFENLVKGLAGIFGQLFGFISKIAESIFPGCSNSQGANDISSFINSMAGQSVTGGNNDDGSQPAVNNNGVNPGNDGSNTPANNNTAGNANAPAAPGTNAPASNAPGNGRTYSAHAYSSTNLISDGEFTDSNYMSLGDIRNFLTRIGSQLANTIHGVDVAAAIKSAADANGINPLVLLATLQKEKGLVQTRSTITQSQLDWACGVGAYDGGNWNNRYKGFANQISSAASTYKNLYNRGAGTISIDNGAHRVTAANAATASVYRYTPHTAGGQLFHSVYEGFKRRFESYK